MLEQKIKEHAAEIFGSEPVNGHRERFAERLHARKKKNVIPLHRLFGYAAAVVLLIALAIPQWKMYQAKQINPEESANDVWNYYNMQLEREVATIEPLLSKVEENERVKIRKDVESIRKDPVPENSISLIVKVYDLKIEALQHIHRILSDNI
jgi:hypothetical protein